MATVYFGRLLGPVGFSRTVAIKRLHPQFAKDPEFVAMFLDEARLAARVKHPNVVSILDVVAREGELFLVMEYVHGESLSRVLRLAAAAGRELPLAVLSAIAVGMLCGLHAAHEARDEYGERLNIVHRDVSPQNVLVGADGVSRLLDFGIAKAVGRLQTTREGQFKGKLSYMSPEQIVQGPVDRRSDVYAAGVVLWGALAGVLPFVGGEASVMYQILNVKVAPPSSVRSSVPPELDALVLRAMAQSPTDRFASALEMASELERIAPPATQLSVAAWLADVASVTLEERAAQVREVEGLPSHAMPPRRDAPRIDLDAAERSDLTALPGITPHAAPEPPTLTSSVVGPKEVVQGRARWVAFGLAGMAIGAVALVGQLQRATEDPASPQPRLPSPAEASATELSAIRPEAAPAPSVSPLLSAVEASATAVASASSKPAAIAPRPGIGKRPALNSAKPKQPDYGF